MVWNERSVMMGSNCIDVHCLSWFHKPQIAVGRNALKRAIVIRRLCLNKPRFCEFYLRLGQVFQMYDRASQAYLSELRCGKSLGSTFPKKGWQPWRGSIAQLGNRWFHRDFTVIYFLRKKPYKLPLGHQIFIMFKKSYSYFFLNGKI